MPTFGFVVAARFDALCFNVFTIKHHHMGFAVIDPDNGVKSGQGFLRWF